QQQIHKTIVFVTHDIREAMTLGTRIALLDVGGVLAQYDTPERLLSAPNNEFVSDFLGSGKEVRRLDLTSVGDVELDPVRTVRSGEADSAGAEPRAVVLDEAGRPQRWLHDRGTGELAVVRSEQSLYDALDVLLSARDDVAVVLDEGDRVVGSLAWGAVLRGLPARPDSAQTVTGPR
ncbi:MAG: hypothetical protein ACRDMV_04775, partial [Streptosporangiales bacterium]